LRQLLPNFRVRSDISPRASRTSIWPLSRDGVDRDKSTITPGGNFSLSRSQAIVCTENKQSAAAPTTLSRMSTNGPLEPVDRAKLSAVPSCPHGVIACLRAPCAGCAIIRGLCPQSDRCRTATSRRGSARCARSSSTGCCSARRKTRRRDVCDLTVGAIVDRLLTARTQRHAGR
jgi:hypothetical protein